LALIPPAAFLVLETQVFLQLRLSTSPVTTHANLKPWDLAGRHVANDSPHVHAKPVSHFLGCQDLDGTHRYPIDAVYIPINETS
jgi:hypothetical protein